MKDHLQLHTYVVAHDLKSIRVVTFDELTRDPAGLTQLLRRWIELGERAITPSAEQAAAIRRLLERDLAVFRDDWGVDPWALEGDRDGRAAGEPAGVERAEQ